MLKSHLHRFEYTESQALEVNEHLRCYYTGLYSVTDLVLHLSTFNIAVESIKPEAVTIVFYRVSTYRSNASLEELNANVCRYPVTKNDIIF